ncbi:MAG: hypothetical protein HY023_00950 [Chloroflexi bacterium]|nr:hypothetical protein [Chloroflexota bacterium]
MLAIPPALAARLIVIALGIGLLISLATGLNSLQAARNLPFYSLRRRATDEAIRYFVATGAFLIMAGIAGLIGRQTLTVAQVVLPSPTLPTSTTSATAMPPETATATDTPIPTATTGSPTATYTPSATPTETGTPQLPKAIITPIASPTVTPPADAVIGPISISPTLDYSLRQASEYFDQSGKTLYALFEYNNFAAGMQWSVVWYRDAKPIFTETIAWNDVPGGRGFWNLTLDDWPLGTYEVRLFAGDRWLRSKTFYVVEVLPTNTPRPSRTPRPPTDTPPP